ncbi:SDR family oxidoreductase [Undibacterium sp. CY18W]|uniref:SDR family oxidoreductase n=1 Tax=Undibacterium hunanense TaxID=2762292 RepID=A0ABR6ZWU7_9BURK|nr:SDR family oxidoreductase [Undibacterium hunanense]MBC3920336.1 SDR family oxidoreductase [Undibacterium hunanense]
MKKVALVTGGSRGIGAATAQQLAAAGYAVCVNYLHNHDAAQQVVQDIRAEGGTAIAIQADVALEADVVRLFAELDQQLGKLDALVNNAGILMQQCRLEDLTAERINRLLSTNVTSYFLCCREAVRRMSRRHGGTGGAIVNVSSAAARLGSANEYIDYATTKGAIDTLTTGLSVEVAGEGIRVNCVRPGLITTTMHADGGEPNRVERLKSGVPMLRGGTPDEVAAAIVFLLGDGASFITGSFVDVSGGR